MYISHLDGKISLKNFYKTLDMYPLVNDLMTLKCYLWASNALNDFQMKNVIIYIIHIKKILLKKLK